VTSSFWTFQRRGKNVPVKLTIGRGQSKLPPIAQRSMLNVLLTRPYASTLTVASRFKSFETEAAERVK
jgi:hypothetical protein